MIDWAESDGVVCSKCGGALTIPFAHVHFHYGTEGLSEKAKTQLQGLVGVGYGDEVGPLGEDMCWRCFHELLEVISSWRNDHYHDLTLPTGDAGKHTQR